MSPKSFEEMQWPLLGNCFSPLSVTTDTLNESFVRFIKYLRSTYNEAMGPGMNTRKHFPQKVIGFKRLSKRSVPRLGTSPQRGQQ